MFTIGGIMEINDIINSAQQTAANNNAWSEGQAQKQMDYQTQSNAIAMKFNATEAQKTRD